MKVIFDCIGASPGSGGPEAHAQEVLRAWVRRYPDDDLIVVGTRWKRLDEYTNSRVHWIRWPNRWLPLRIIGQLIWIPILMSIYRRRILLVSVPVLSPFSPKRRSFVFAHDWRHLVRPDEFPMLRRIYRAIWLDSVKRAAITFCISGKTLDETAGFAPNAVLVLAENGHDHALRWRDSMTTANSPALRTLAEDGDVVLTFGHRNNKRPELVINALGTLTVKPHLVVLGANGSYRAALAELAEARGVADRVHFPGYVSDEEYQCLMMNADCVVLASSDEGFGLPVAEALSLGRPVVVTSDSGLDRTFADSVRVADPEHEAIGKAIADALAGRDVPTDYNASTWTDTVTTVREAISAAMPALSVED